MSPADKDTYQIEELTKFIYGRRPLEEYDAFVQTLYDTYELEKYMEIADSVLKASGYIR
jgi:putative aldouronate transport system substrate-binding protein